MVLSPDGRVTRPHRPSGTVEVIAKMKLRFTDDGPSTATFLIHRALSPTFSEPTTLVTAFLATNHSMSPAGSFIRYVMVSVFLPVQLRP
jgi:hypothetical protein